MKSQNNFELTHDYLVEKARKYLFNNLKCSVVLTELNTRNIREIPDAIGWCNSNSTLIECKTSKQDLQKDKKKIFRGKTDLVTGEEYGSTLGVGNFRYYLTEKDLLINQNLPKKWGLLELYNNKIIEIKKATYIESNKNNEIELLISTLRRMKIKEDIGLNIRIYKDHGFSDLKNKASLTYKQINFDYNI